MVSLNDMIVIIPAGQDDALKENRIDIGTTKNEASISIHLRNISQTNITGINLINKQNVNKISPDLFPLKLNSGELSDMFTITFDTSHTLSFPLEWDGDFTNVRFA